MLKIYLNCLKNIVSGVISYLEIVYYMARGRWFIEPSIFNGKVYRYHAANFRQLYADSCIYFFAKNCKLSNMKQLLIICMFTENLEKYLKASGFINLREVYPVILSTDQVASAYYQTSHQNQSNSTPSLFCTSFIVFIDCLLTFSRCSQFLHIKRWSILDFFENLMISLKGELQFFLLKT